LDDEDEPLHKFHGTKSPAFNIERGVMKQDDDPFFKFKRENINIWGQISMLISQLESWIGQYIVKIAQVSSV
jgi:hypothetical protein